MRHMCQTLSYQYLSSDYGRRIGRGWIWIWCGLRIVLRVRTSGGITSACHSPSQAHVLNTIISSPTILTRTIRSASDHFNGAYHKCAGWRSLILHMYAASGALAGAADSDCPYPHARAHAPAACTTHHARSIFSLHLDTQRSISWVFLLPVHFIWGVLC
jgi:hypothetical protein